MRGSGALLAAALLAGPVLAQEGVLRVCADPHNPPFSMADGSGFENRIAQMLAQDLHARLAYEWLPDRRGFLRKTLGEGRCDLVMGVPSGVEKAATSRPYYRSGYVLLQPRSATPIAALDDPRLANLRVGIPLLNDGAAAAPPAAVLAAQGWTAKVRGFPFAGEEPAAARMVDALAHGELDAALLWGPQAGWFARRSPEPLRVALLPQPGGTAPPLRFDIAMGVRRGNAALLARLDDFIARRGPDIARILDDYAVPRIAKDAP